MSKFLNIIVREQLLEQSGSRSTVVHHLAFHRKYELPACHCLRKSWRQDSRKQWNQSTLNFLCETWSHQTLNFLCEVPQTIIFSVRSPRHWTFPMRLGLPDIDWLREDYSLACDWSDSLWYLWLYLFLCDIIFVCFSISLSLLLLPIFIFSQLSFSSMLFGINHHVYPKYFCLVYCQSFTTHIFPHAMMSNCLSSSLLVCSSSSATVPFSWRTAVSLLMTYFSRPSYDILQSPFSWCTPIFLFMMYSSLPNHDVLHSPFSCCNPVSLFIM